MTLALEDLTIRELRSAVEFLPTQVQSAVLKALVGYEFGQLEALVGKPAALLLYERIRAAIRKPQHDAGMQEYGLRAMATH